MLNHLTLGAKVALAFAGAVLLAAVTGAVALYPAHGIATQLEDVVQVKLAGVQVLAAVAEAHEVTQAGLATLLTRDYIDEGMRRHARAEVEEALATADEEMQRFDALPESSSMSGDWPAASAAHRAWRAAAGEMVRLVAELEAAFARGQAPEEALRRRTSSSYRALLATMAPFDAALHPIQERLRAEGRPAPRSSRWPPPPVRPPRAPRRRAPWPPAPRRAPGRGPRPSGS